MNDNVLLSEIDYFNCHILKLAYNGDCKKFIATQSVQKVLKEIWANSIIFSPDQLIFYDYNKLEFLKSCLCYASLGLIAPFFQKIEITNQSKLRNYEMNNMEISFDSKRNEFVSAYRLVKSNPKKYHIDYPADSPFKNYSIRYRNFMYSPRAHFVYETVSSKTFFKFK